MTIEEFEINSKDGNRLYGKYWLPENDITPPAVLCLVHGLGEHTGRYEGLAEFFTSNNIPVFSFDQVGHGKSDGKRGHGGKYEILLDNIENLLKVARREYNDALMFLYGQSWGGNIVANYVLKKNTSELAGAILSAPWLRLPFKPAPSKVFLARMMNSIFPSYTEKSEIDPEKLSKDKTVVGAYKSDPLVHDRISASLFFNAVRNGEEAINNSFKLTIPMLAIHGKEDKLTSWNATEEFVQGTSGKASFQLYDDVRHEPHNDLEREEVLSDVLSWINSKS